MMTSFSPKLMTAVVILLLVGDFPATSAGCRKSLWHVSETQSRDGLMKMVPREEGSSECLNIKGKKIVFFRSLREFSSPPPSPMKNGRKSMNEPEPPPPIL
ncbi:hypothetical protein ACJW31_04G138000 [Castanea mollissima]